ncbi:MAG: hypothetical protein V3U78_04680 [Thiotrichaceae bacterium]
MTAKNRADIQSEIDSLYATNLLGNISALDGRTLHTTSTDSNLNIVDTSGVQLIQGDLNFTGAIQIKGQTVTLNPDQARVGIIEYADLATATTPISVPAGLVFTDLTNDGVGPTTEKSFKVTGLSELWDVSTQQFIFTDMVLGDQLGMQINFEMTTSANNQLLKLRLLAGIGGITYTQPWIEASFKTSGTHEVTINRLFYMRDTNTLDNGARIQIASDATADIEVRNFTIQHFLRN